MLNSESDTVDTLKARIAELEATITELEGASKMLIGRDLSLRRAYEDLKSVDAQKSDFISIAAHQLRTPLTTANWAHTMLLEKSDNMTEQQRELLTQSAASIGHMHQLVEDLLELNHIEYGSFTIKKVPQSVEELLETVCAELNTHSATKNITLTTTWAPHLTPVAFDQIRLQEVFVNIIENAIKYTPKDGHVAVTTSYTNTECSISISDTGPGIPEAKHEVIFHKFTRLPDAKKADPNGTGLGLYIAKKIVELHNGTIAIKPDAKEGTTFVITLPLI